MWRWRCAYVRGTAQPRSAIEEADRFLARLAEADAIPRDPHGQPVPATVILNPSSMSATITYYGEELSSE